MGSRGIEPEASWRGIRPEEESLGTLTDDRWKTRESLLRHHVTGPFSSRSRAKAYIASEIRPSFDATSPGASA